MKKPSFMLFGMGPRRRKLVYSNGRLLDAWTLEPVRSWGQVQNEELDQSERTVKFIAENGTPVEIHENEDGLFLEDGANVEALSNGDRVNLPRFNGKSHAAAMRRAHADILTNITHFGPVPNIWAYPRPWYRDAAMVAMVLKQTGNLHLIKDWVLGLRKPFDRNNDGEREPDNIGQVLFLLSLFPEGRKHPLVPKLLAEAESFDQGGWICGRSDGKEHPVYQTKWLKFGLRAMGLDDSKWIVPDVPDSYDSLFWMDKGSATKNENLSFGLRDLENWPYLNWAEAHSEKGPPPQNPDTWTYEANASESDGAAAARLASAGVYPADCVEPRCFFPHTWHSAEIFLYLSDFS